MNELIKKTVEWHRNRNLIDGATDESQSVKLLEEYVELVATFMSPNSSALDIVMNVENTLEDLRTNKRIHPVPRKERVEAKKDALGDMLVVMINIAERNGWSIEECLQSAYNEIEHRKGKMVGGTYVKEEDL